MTITGRQIHKARVLLMWDRSTLVRRTAMPTTVVEHAEASDGEPHITLAHQIAIKHALVGAGVDFTADPPGVRFRPTSITVPTRPDHVRYR